MADLTCGVVTSGTRQSGQLTEAQIRKVDRIDRSISIHRCPLGLDRLAGLDSVTDIQRLG